MGFPPFTDKRVIPDMGTVKERYSQKPKKVTAAGHSFVIADNLIRNRKILILKAKPFFAIGAMNGEYPIFNTRKQNYPNHHQYY